MTTTMMTGSITIEDIFGDIIRLMDFQWVIIMTHIIQIGMVGILVTMILGLDLVIIPVSSLADILAVFTVTIIFMGIHTLAITGMEIHLLIFEITMEDGA
jgi:hypothetical protein